jgi:hypothetical protein
MPVVTSNAEQSQRSPRTAPSCFPTQLAFASTSSRILSGCVAAFEISDVVCAERMRVFVVPAWTLPVVAILGVPYAAFSRPDIF